MKKITANIQLIHEGIKQIAGYYTEIKLDTGETVEVIIHRDTKYPDYWTVSEYSTGIELTPYLPDSTIAKTRNQVLEHTLNFLNERLRERNTTLHEVKQDFLKSMNLNYVN